MCGICGIRHHDRQARVDPTVLARMNRRLAHRGPDDDGYYVTGNLGLGHRRLAIIDLDGGRQPLGNEDGSVWVAFNGEIYNYRELRTRLQARGHVFRTRSDTEVIVHAYEEYGDDCVLHFRGMFAFAVADRQRNRLLLARDRLGIKPLYYRQDASGVAFASEIKSLLELPECEREVDPVALDQYLSLRYVPGPRTMFRDIAKLMPGHVLVADDRGVRTRRYWRLQPEQREDLDFAQARERFSELLEEAVRLRLIADVPLGVMLSGGLDSSAILATMIDVGATAPVRSFSVGYDRAGDDDDSDERAWARMVAERLGSLHRELELGPNEFGDFLPQLVWHLDEPMADPTCAPLYFLSRMAREDVTVVLSGEGADEMLAGYGIYGRMRSLQRLRSLLPSPMASLAAGLAPLVPHEGARDWLERADLPLEQAYQGVSRAFRPHLKQELLGRSRDHADTAVHEALAPHFASASGASDLNRMLAVDLGAWLPDDLLLKADRMTMANSMELRVPFLDHHLVEFVASLPDCWKLGPSGGKHLLRAAVRERVPRQVIERRKKGFPVPTRSWLRGSLDPVVRQTLLADDCACGNYMDRSTIRRLADEHARNTHDRTQELWALLIFESWHRQFAVGDASRAEPSSSHPDFIPAATAARATPHDTGGGSAHPMPTAHAGGSRS